MITYVVGDLLQSPARVLVNTVNTLGVMGKGIAKDFKNIYPEMFTQYQSFCEKRQFDIGMLWLYKTKHKWILNFPTKKNWRHPSKMEYIEAGLSKFVSSYTDKGITSIAFPMLGCGNGGLDWELEVRPVMEQYLKNLPIDVYIHLYRNDPFQSEHKNINEIKTWLRSQPENLPFSEVWEDLANILDKNFMFHTLDEKIGFTAKIINQPELGLELRANGKVSFISFDQLVDLWQHVRSLGFLISSSAPYELGQYTPYLVSILEPLPYLKPVLISSNYHEMRKNPIGLQYIPDISEKIPDISQDLYVVSSYE